MDIDNERKKNDTFKLMEFIKYTFNWLMDHTSDW